MFKSKSLTDFTNSFLPRDFEKNNNFYLLPATTVEMRNNKSFPEVPILHYIHQVGYVCIVISHKCFWIAEWLCLSFLMWERPEEKVRYDFLFRT